MPASNVASTRSKVISNLYRGVMYWEEEEYIFECRMHHSNSFAQFLEDVKNALNNGRNTCGNIQNTRDLQRVKEYLERKLTPPAPEKTKKKGSSRRRKSA